MKKWKSLFAVAAIATLVFSMAACGDKDTAADPTEAPNPTEAPVEPTEAPAEPTEAPVPTEVPSDNATVINFADLTEGGYGYEATKENGAVNVSIAAQYQEIQYVLPETVDLAQYSKMVIDLTSNNQLDIKLVDPDASVNEYGQYAPFKDNYTAEGAAIEAPVEIDLAEFADYDLCQINFMAVGNDTAFTLKSITFVKADSVDTPAEPTEAPADPTEAPAEPTEAPAEPTEAPEATATPVPTEAPKATATPVPTEAPKATATPVPTEAPKATATPAPTATPVPTEAPAKDEGVINFADIEPSNFYGCEISKDGDTVVVAYSADNTYQEVQYILPEVIDLAQYSTMIVDVTCDGQLGIKLVNPEAEPNQWGSLAEFVCKYTAQEAPITEPIYIDLAEYSNYDLYEVNFMNCQTGITANIKSITFVK